MQQDENSTRVKQIKRTLDKCVPGSRASGSELKSKYRKAIRGLRNRKDENNQDRETLDQVTQGNQRVAKTERDREREREG